jgi:hypothetical protein
MPHLYCSHRLGVAANVLTKASHDNDAGNANAHASNAYKWDLAIAWGWGRHIVVLTYARILVCVAIMLVVAAIVAAIRFF